MSRPACNALSASSPSANTATRIFFPVPCGNSMVPRMFCEAFRGSTPSPTAISIVSSNFASLPPLTSSSAWCTEQGSGLLGGSDHGSAENARNGDAVVNPRRSVCSIVASRFLFRFRCGSDSRRTRDFLFGTGLELIKAPFLLQA